MTLTTFSQTNFQAKKIIMVHTVVHICLAGSEWTVAYYQTMGNANVREIDQEHICVGLLSIRVPCILIVGALGACITIMAVKRLNNNRINYRLCD